MKTNKQIGFWGMRLFLFAFYVILFPQRLAPIFCLACFCLMSCQATSYQQDTSDTPRSSEARAKANKNGAEYHLFERARMTDNIGFSEPAEAYSLLLPKGWQHQSEVIWNNPGTACQGTFYRLKAESSDHTARLEIFPDVVYTWNSNPELRAFYQNNSQPSSQCGMAEPVNAEQYLRTVFGPKELGNPEIIQVEPNTLVVNQMRQGNEKATQELMAYGSGPIQFTQTAINAQVRWPDGTRGLVLLGVNSMETVIPNVYTGAYDKSYTTQVTKRTVFRYPEGEREKAEQQFVVMMSSFRTNPAWNESVNQFWKQVRQRSHQVHVGRIKLMDAQTRAMGEAAIRNGQARLDAMDNQMRSWEQRQSSQDRMHTNFVKTIREVEHYQDETGTIELGAGYNHAWSRSDGNSFILSNDPMFDPSSVFQDQRWKEMKKVD